MQHRRRDAQVVIVGGGPVGLGLAIELGQRGVRTVLVERLARALADPAGQNLTQRTMEHFHFWGVEKEVRAARTIPREYGIGGLTAYGTLLGPYSYDWMQRELVRPFYFTDNERLPQYATEAVLRRRVGELACVETLYGWSASEVSQDDGGVSVVITERAAAAAGACGPTISWAATAAGPSCASRRGITQTLSDHDRLMVLLVFRSQGLHGLLERGIPESRSSAFCIPTCRAIGSSSAGSTSAHVVLPRAGARRDDQGTTSTSAAWSTRRPVPSSTSSSSTSASGSCASLSPTATARAAFSSPATPPTVIRPTAATA